MLKPIDREFAGSAAAEAPLVLAYIGALILLAFVWSNFSPPANGMTELHSAAMAKNAEKKLILLP